VAQAHPASAVLSEAPADASLAPHCPRCASSLRDEQSFVNESWAAVNTILTCWCVRCGWFGDITEYPVMLGIDQETE
jgi:hypothetical protein